MNPDSHKMRRREEKQEQLKLKEQLGKERFKDVQRTLSALATGKMIRFNQVEAPINIPPAPHH